jgi:hypothetical protein
LKLVGLQEIDDLLITFEPMIKDIDFIRTEVDLRFTDFINTLGANKFWERGIGFNDIVRMLIIVLSINHEKGVESIEFTEDSPYIKYDSKNVSYKIRWLYSDFKDYVSAVVESSEKLKKIQVSQNFEELSSTIQSLSNEITEKAISSEYTTDELIESCEIFEADLGIIKKASNSLKKIIRLAENIKLEIRDIIDESFSTSKFPKIIQQCALAKHQGLSTPETIVRFFWPYPNI